MADHTVELNTGARMPLLGLGTFRLRGAEELRRCVDAALAAGYRGFDTAAVYGNEEELGRALAELLPRHGLRRADVFVTSKLGPRDQGAGAAEACRRSVARLGAGYLDLYLVHWPGTQGRPAGDPQNRQRRRESWEALEAEHRAGRLRAIGVSNYTPAHLRELLAGCAVPPAVLQVELHPALPQPELLALCGQAGVHLQAYSSLGGGQLLAHPVVREVAAARGRAPAQVLLRWGLQRGAGVIPKSGQPARIAENARLFDFQLGPEDMHRLGALGSGTRYCWDPNTVA
ncbi:aldo-keto reductase Mkms_1985 [Lepisosteus oculatus]|uniref:aldo-keto reductase Mkms_1985 n=1 Tax=Lepisosteus oculatus TaxID=7918 RepID=UPI0035F509C2